MSGLSTPTFIFLNQVFLNQGRLRLGSAPGAISRHGPEMYDDAAGLRRRLLGESARHWDGGDGTQVRELVVLAIGGALGTVSRYSVGLWAYHNLGAHFAFATLFVNVIGCFLLGLLMELGLNTEAISRTAHLAMTAGFLGAFTTFSTFGYETIRYVENGSVNLAVANVLANLGFGMIAAWIGVVAGRALIAYAV